ncbi:hypothetical protein [Metabacillus sp. FJAT-52054]|uniref:Uncharacterized protein n=1 Tax=Metabacillus sediminis TaxID=3117746 RepID=A0ABZ2NEP6_9BACI
MDEQTFEERLRQLGHSYDGMPDRTSAQEITKNILQREGKKRRLRLSMPAAASIAGIILIGGLLSFQLFKGPESSPGEGKPGILSQEQDPPSTEKIKEKSEEARALYNERLKKLKEKLRNEDAELYPFVQEANQSIKKFSLRPFANEKELQNQSEQLQEKVKMHVSSIDEQMDMLQEKAKQGETISDDDLLLLLAKQDQMYDRYNEKWENSADLIAPDFESFKTVIASMNDGTFENEKLKPVVEEIRGAGYRFFDAGEGMINIQPDYGWPKQKLGGRISASYSEWADFNLNKPYMADNTIIDDIKAGERLVEMEEFALSNPNFTRMDKVKTAYRDLFQNYVSKGFFDPNRKAPSQEFEESLLNLKRKFPDSDTFKEIALLHQKYKDGKLDKQESYAIPPSMQPAVPEFSQPVILFPLTEQMSGMYKDLQASKDPVALIAETGYKGNMNTEQITVLRIYLYAMLKKDYETAYILTDTKKSKSEFIQEAQKAKADFLSLNTKAKYLKVNASDGEEGITALELYSLEGIEQTFYLKTGGGGLSSRVQIGRQE